MSGCSFPPAIHHRLRSIGVFVCAAVVVVCLRPPVKFDDFRPGIRDTHNLVSYLVLMVRVFVSRSGATLRKATVLRGTEMTS